MNLKTTRVLFLLSAVMRTSEIVNPDGSIARTRHRNAGLTSDGRQLQRVGIQPHIKVARTIRGIVEGRDEILEVAVTYLKTANLRK